MTPSKIRSLFRRSAILHRCGPEANPDTITVIAVLARAPTAGAGMNELQRRCPTGSCFGFTVVRCDEPTDDLELDIFLEVEPGDVRPHPKSPAGLNMPGRRLIKEIECEG